MKTFWKLLLILVMIFVISGCPGNGEETVVTPVGTVTVTVSGQPIPTDGLWINAGESVTVAISASKADSYGLRSASTGVASVTGLTITGVSQGSSIITASAANASGGSAQTTFTVNVRPKLTSFKVFHGINEIPIFENAAATTSIDMQFNYSEVFSFAVEPAGAQNKFELVSDPAVNVTMEEKDGKWEIKSTTEQEVVITVKPAQNGLTPEEINAGTRYFKLNFIDVPQIGVSVLDIKDANDVVISQGAEITLARGWELHLTADTNVTFDLRLEWETDTDAVSIEQIGFGAVITATEEINGGEAAITVTASNRFNTTPVTRTFKIDIPERGNVLFEWRADWGFDDGTDRILQNELRNYPGFRDVYITSIGNATSVNRTAEKATSFRVGNPGLPTPFGHQRLVIGTATNTAGNAPLITDPTIAGMTQQVGTLDLRRPVRMTLEFEDYNLTTQWFRVQLNNNTSSAGASNIGAPDQIRHYRVPTANLESWEVAGQSNFITTSTMTGNSGVHSFIIDFSNFNTYFGASNVVLPPGGQTNIYLEYAFLALNVQNAAGQYVDISAIKLEYVNPVDIDINREADFTGFPTERFTLSGTNTITLAPVNPADYTTAQWFINGEKVDDDVAVTLEGLRFILDVNHTYEFANGSTLELEVGKEYSLTAIVKVGAHIYSRMVRFTVAETVGE